MFVTIIHPRMNTKSPTYLEKLGWKLTELLPYSPHFARKNRRDQNGFEHDKNYALQKFQGQRTLQVLENNLGFMEPQLIRFFNYLAKNYSSQYRWEEVREPQNFSKMKCFWRLLGSLGMTSPGFPTHLRTNAQHF